MKKLLIFGIVFLFSLIAVNATPYVYLSANGMNLGERVTYDLEANKKYNFYAWGNNEIDEVYLYIKDSEFECTRGKTCRLEYTPTEVGKQIQLDVIGYKNKERLTSQKFYIDIITDKGDVGEDSEDKGESDSENIITIDKPQKGFSVDYCKSKLDKREIGQVEMDNGYNFIFDFSNKHEFKEIATKVKTMNPSLYYRFWNLDEEQVDLYLYYYKRHEQLDLFMEQYPDMEEFFKVKANPCDRLLVSYNLVNGYFNTLNDYEVEGVKDYNKDANFNVLIIPLAWDDNSYEDFEANSKVVESKLTDALGFNSCSDKINVITATKKEYEEALGNWYCEAPMSEICLNEDKNQNYRYFLENANEMAKLEDCSNYIIEKTQINFHRVIGLVPNNVDVLSKSCERAGDEAVGYTYLFHTHVIGTPISIMHEIGHTLGFKDQYTTSDYYLDLSVEEIKILNEGKIGADEAKELYVSGRVENVGENFKDLAGSSFREVLNPFDRTTCNGGFDLSCVSYIVSEEGEHRIHQQGVVHVFGNLDITGNDRTVMAHGNSHFDYKESKHIENLVSCNKKFDIKDFNNKKNKVIENRKKTLAQLRGD